eukprot:3637439-Prymnesium_polylepis.1
MAPPPREHSLLLVHKQGRRGLANFEQVRRHLAGGCDGHCAGIKVVTVELHTMSIRRQLELVSTSTLAISPPGGVSMILPFLPEGAHAILINYMLGGGASIKERKTTKGLSHQECAGCSWTMEAELWSHMRNVRTLFYQVWDADDFAGRRPGRDVAVVIKLPRLAYLVRAALNAMDDAAQDQEE